MPQVSVVFSFEQYAAGWSEKYITEGASSNLNDYYNRAAALAGKRMMLSGKQTFMTYIRLSQEGVSFDSLLYAYPGAGLQGSPAIDSDAPTTCLLVNLADVTRSFKKKVYLRGVWDTVVDVGGKYTPTPTYVALFNNWWAYLKSDNGQPAASWGWYANERPGTKRNVLSITQEVSGTIRITTSSGAWPGPFPMNPQQVRLSGIVDSPNLNGELVVIPISAQVAVSLRRIAAFECGAAGFMRYATQLIRTTDFGSVQRVGERRVGRPSYQPRGRQRVRVRG